MTIAAAASRPPYPLFFGYREDGHGDDHREKQSRPGDRAPDGTGGRRGFLCHRSLGSFGLSLNGQVRSRFVTLIVT